MIKTPQRALVKFKTEPEIQNRSPLTPVIAFCRCSLSVVTLYMQEDFKARKMICFLIASWPDHQLLYDAVALNTVQSIRLMAFALTSKNRRVRK